MSRMKDWLMEHDEAFGESLNTNPKSLGEVLNYVHDQIQVVDDKYVRALWKEYTEGEPVGEWEDDDDEI